MTQRCYIAGRIRHMPDYNRAAFAKAADAMRRQGWQVYNPAAANLEHLPLAQIMAHVLTQLCECQAIALLPGWWRSGGARVEWLLAGYLKLKRIYL